MPRTLLGRDEDAALPALIRALNEREASGNRQWCRERMLSQTLDDTEVHLVIIAKWVAVTSVSALDGVHVVWEGLDAAAMALADTMV
jgi:hypothetical protein